MQKQLTGFFICTNCPNYKLILINITGKESLTFKASYSGASKHKKLI